jgi:predicted dehydrogenase
MVEALRVGTIGAGYFARFHHEAWQRLGHARLTAICDTDLAKATEAALPSGAKAYDDAGQMLAKAKLDIVDIATPPATHLALVEAALAHPPAVIVCQKPLAPSLAEAEKIVALAEAADVPLVVHENFRFQPWYREIKRVIGLGRMGTLHGIAFRLRPGDGQGPDAYLARQPYFQQMPRLLIHETGIHFIDVFRWLVGEVAAVSADLRRLNPTIQGEDAGTVLFRFAGGERGLFDGNRLNDHVADNPRLTMGEMWLEGEAGVLRLDGDGGLWFKRHHGPELAHTYRWHDRGFAGDCVASLQRHVIEYLKDGKPLVNTGRDYLRNIQVEEAVYRSAEQGCWVEV